jgi:hypothetical protein
MGFFINHFILLHSVFKYPGYIPALENIRQASALVIRHHIKSEIIGDWLYCFPPPLIACRLEALGFWYSSKHRAYVYSGGEREGQPDLESLDEIRYRLGSHQII